MLPLKNGAMNKEFELFASTCLSWPGDLLRFHRIVVCIRKHTHTQALSQTETHTHTPTQAVHSYAAWCVARVFNFLLLLCSLLEFKSGRERMLLHASPSILFHLCLPLFPSHSDHLHACTYTLQQILQTQLSSHTRSLVKARMPSILHAVVINCFCNTVQEANMPTASINTNYK